MEDDPDIIYLRNPDEPDSNIHLDSETKVYTPVSTDIGMEELEDGNVAKDSNHSNKTCFKIDLATQSVEQCHENREITCKFESEELVIGSPVGTIEMPALRTICQVGVNSGTVPIDELTNECDSETGNNNEGLSSYKENVKGESHLKQKNVQANSHVECKSDDQSVDTQFDGTSILVKLDYSETQTDTLPQNVVFVAEEKTIHLYKVTSRFYGTDEMNSDVCLHKKSGADSNYTDMRDGNDQLDNENKLDDETPENEPKEIYCRTCMKCHSPSLMLMIPPQALLQKFEDDIVSGLGNSPEDENNLCDNLLPNQIKYLPMIRQAESSGGGANIMIDIESVKALEPEYLNTIARKHGSQLSANKQCIGDTVPKVDATGNIMYPDNLELQAPQAHSMNSETALTNMEARNHLSKAPPNKLVSNEIEKAVNALADDGNGHIAKSLDRRKSFRSAVQQPAETGLKDLTPGLKSSFSMSEINVDETITDRLKLVNVDAVSTVKHCKIENIEEQRKKTECSDAKETFIDQTESQKLKHQKPMRKTRPTLEDIAAKYNVTNENSNSSEGWYTQFTAEQEKKQTALEHRNAVIEAGLLPKEYSEPESSVVNRMMALTMLKWIQTIVKVDQNYEKAISSNDPEQIVSAFTENTKQRKDCLAWVTTVLEKHLTEKQSQQSGFKSQRSVDINNVLSQLKEMQFREEKSSKAISEIMKWLLEMIKIKELAEKLPALDETFAAPPENESERKQELYSQITALLTVLESRDKTTGLNDSTAPSYTSDQTSPDSSVENTTGQSFKRPKPFTGVLIKNQSYDGRKDVLPSSPVRRIAKQRKNKNTQPVKVTKSSTDKDKTLQDNSAMGTQTGRVGETGTFDNDFDRATWKSNPVYNSSQEMQVISDKCSNKHQTLVYKSSKYGDYYNGDFKDIHHGNMSARRKDSDFGNTRTSSGRLPRTGTYQSINLDEQLEDVAHAMGTTVFHVPSDGNCMFSAIVDQLKLLGNFKYTTQSLRHKAVQYLRDNPIHEDGTPLECFLSAESWDSYLCRMGQENTWGDHLILNGIAELLRCRIMVATVTREQTSTNEIEPSYCKSEVTLMIGLKGEIHFESLRPMDWDERLIQLAKRPVPRKARRRPEKKKKPQLAFAAMLAESRQPIKSVSDMSETRGDSSEYDTAVDYVNQYIPEWLLSNAYLWDPLSNSATPHLSYILRLLYTSDYILNRQPMHFDHDELSDKSDFGAYHLSGSCFEGTEVYLSRRYERCGRCNYTVQQSTCDCTKTHDWKRYFCMKDTLVLSPEFDVPSDRDLIKDDETSPVGYLKLVPVNETAFSNQLVSSDSGKKLLKKLKPVEHKLYVKRGQKPSYQTVDKQKDKCKSEDLIVFQTEWPQVAEEWVSRKRLSGWPDERCIEEGVKMGCFVVPAVNRKVDSGNQRDDDALWQYSFSGVQSYLIRDCLVNDQLHTFHIFKVLLDECVHCPDILTTETLSQLFLYASEEIPLELWHKNSAVCLLFMVERLQRQVEARFIPNYFIPGKNMVDPENFQRLNILADRLRSFRRFPLVYILTCAEKHNLGKYRVNGAVQATIQDMQQFKNHKNMAIAVKDTFSRLSVGLASTWINEMHHYELGYSQIVVAYSEWCRGLEYGLDQIPFDSFINQIVSQSLSTFEQWMFVFYTKEKFQVQYRPDIFGYTPCHTLRDIMGETAGRLHNVVVPDCVSSLGFEFLKKFIYLLFNQLFYFADVIPIIEYTIQEYGDQVIELTEEDIQRYDYQGSNPNYKLQVKQYEHNRVIFDLYVLLYNACTNTDQAELFLQYLPGAESVGERIYEEYDYKRLEHICQGLKLEEKVKEIREKRSEFKEENNDMNE